jgi:hypothetical protein
VAFVCVRGAAKVDDFDLAGEGFVPGVAVFLEGVGVRIEGGRGFLRAENLSFSLDLDRK